MNGDRLAQLQIVQAQPPRGHRPGKDGLDCLHAKWLQHIVERAQLHRVDRSLNRALSGHDYGYQIWIDLQR